MFFLFLLSPHVDFGKAKTLYDSLILNAFNFRYFNRNKLKQPITLKK